jgi:hypothetical protein
VVSGVSGEPADLADRVAAAAQANERRYQLLEKIDYPEGIRMAVNFTCDFDAMLLRRLLNEPVPQRAQGEFGGRVGIWRLIELFDAHDVKATIFTPGRICELYPDSLRTGPSVQVHRSAGSRGRSKACGYPQWVFESAA